MLERAEHHLEFRGSIPRPKRDRRRAEGTLTAVAALVGLALWSTSDAPETPSRIGGISMLPADLAFAAQPVSITSAPQSVTLVNSGDVDVPIGDIQLSRSDAFAMQTTGCSNGTIPAHGSCVVQVRFTPVVPGDHIVVIERIDRSGDRQSVVARGTSVAVRDGAVIPARAPSTPGPAPAPRLAASFTPASVTFDQVAAGKVASASIVLRNTGTVTLDELRLQVQGNDADFAVRFEPSSQSSGDTGCLQLAPAAACMILISFAPQREGMHTAQLIARNGGRDLARVSLTGHAELPPAPLAEISPNPVELTRAERKTTVQVRNTGAAPLVISSLNLQSPEFQIGKSNCLLGRPLDPGEMCSTEITFRGKQTAQAVLQVEHNDTRADAPKRVLLMGDVPPNRKRDMIWKAVTAGAIGGAVLAGVLQSTGDKRGTGNRGPGTPTGPQEAPSSASTPTGGRTGKIGVVPSAPDLQRQPPTVKRAPVVR